MARLIGVLSVCASLQAGAGNYVGRTALWHVVNDLCLPMQQALSMPLPCLKVDGEKGFVVIRAPLDETRFLVVPTKKIEGVESPLVLQDDMPNLWSYAWSERSRITKRVDRPLDWDDIGMAINSRRSRTQDQLHIHVDCVDVRLKRALSAHFGDISTKWSVLDLKPWADQYRVKIIGAAGLNQNIFKLIAEEIPEARSRMAQQTIGVVGFLGKSGEHEFAVLVNGRSGRAEELLNHACAKGD